MPQVLVRDIEPEVYERLKARARSNRRSLEAELRLLFQQAVEEPTTDIHAQITQVRGMFAGRHFSDSAELLRDDRDR